MNFRELFNNVIKKGFFYIFGSSVLGKITQFILSIIVVRLLTKSDYGAYSYANNIFSVVMLFSGLGVISGVLQFSSSAKTDELKKAYLLYALKIGFVTNIIIGTGIIIGLRFINLPIEDSEKYLQLMAYLGLFVLIPQIISVFLRSNFENKRYAILSTNMFVMNLILSLLGLYFFRVYGLISAKYLTNLYLIIIGLFLIKEFYNVQRERLNKEQIKDFLKYSITAMFSNSLSSILYIIDIFLIGLIIKDSIILSEYKVATIIPFALIFIPASIITFAYPYFAKNYENKEYVRKYYKKLILVSILINGTISLILFIFAPLIIKLLFGAKYINSVLPFRILSIGYFISSSFRIPGGNILASLKKIKISLYNSIISGATNIVLDIILIYNLGSKGAAISTTLIFFLSALLSNGYLIYYLFLRRAND